MRLCAYWDCMEEVEEGMSFCREHGMKLNRQLIDKCPKCGRYKDNRQKMCPDCTYGRPVPGWKVMSRNLEEVDESADQVNRDAGAPEKNSPAFSGGAGGMPSSFSRGEATCPSCGSSNLTYKKVFDYFRCNDCETTFITPVYSYGETPDRTGRAGPGVPPANRNYPGAARHEQPPARYEMPPARYEQPPARYETPPARYEQPPARYEQPPPRYEQPYAEPQPSRRSDPGDREPSPVYLGKEPNLEIMRRQQISDRALNMKALKKQGQGGKIGWIYLLVVLCIFALLALLGWLFFGPQITKALQFSMECFQALTWS